MKKLTYIFSLLAVASLAVVSCQQKEEPHEKGPAEAAGCYGVFFPTQDASGSHVYTPVQDKSVEITLKRTNTNGAITVPIKATYSADGIFTMADASFADGQDETTFTVRFDGADDGVTYKASFVIEDTNYASIYSSNPIALDFSFMCVEMMNLKDESGNEATVTFTVKPDFLADFGITETYTVKGTIEYYEVGGIRYCSVVPEEGGLWKSDAVLSFTWYPNVTYTYNDVDYQPLEVAVGATGYELDGAEVGMDHPCKVLFCDYYHHYSDLKGNDLGTYLDFVENYGQSYELSYYDGHGGFHFNLVYDIDETNYWYGFCEDSVLGIASGYSRVNYSIKAQQTGVSEDGKVPVSFVLGADVAKAVYSFAEGTLTATQIGNAIAALDFDSKDAITESGTYGFELGNTGTYTMVVATYSSDGAQKESTSCDIIYLAAEDAEDYAVIINGGLGSAAKYAPSGVNTDNSLECYVYGTNIVEAKIAAFSLADLASDYDACVVSLKKAKSVSQENLDAINGSGYVDVITGLLPGTQYYLLVYASNGYAETVKYFGPQYTTGDPLPIYQNFSASDIDDSLIPATSEGFFGQYNFYNVNFFDNTTGLREYCSKVTIADSEIPDSEPDDNGISSEYVEISGMFADAAKAYDFDDTQLWEFYGGVLYNLGAEGQQLGAAAGGKYYAQLFVLTSEGSIYRNYGSMLIGGFVMDGYIAFASSELYNDGSLGENGLFLRFYSDEGYTTVAGNVDGFTDMLLVDVNKDENGVAPAPAAIASKKVQLRSLSKDITEARTNFVETPRGYIHSIIDKHNEKAAAPQAAGHFAGVKGAQMSVRLVTPQSVKYLGAPVAGSALRVEKVTTPVIK